MKRAHRERLWPVALAVAALLGMATLAPAVSKDARPHGEEVELFAGIEQKQIEVQLIPRDDMQCRLLISNKTERPLSIKLPASFAGVPVLAQPLFGLPANNNNNRNNNNKNNNPFQPNAKDPQRVGGGQPAANFDIAPEATRTLKVETVCLDHNNPTPRPTMKYEIRSMAAATDKEGVAEICELMGRHEMGHRVAQLAAWHLNNDLSWEALAGLRTKQAIGTVASYSKDEIAAAKKASERALALHKQRQEAAGKQASKNPAGS